MKKFAALAALVAVVAFAAPVFAATNPFMDVPMNHWAYDAIGQLAAHGILSGYPDGTYKGKQPTTRYEMASALARALAVVDMTKASKQDVEMLKKLVVEFKDELEALGVKVAELDERVSLIEERLGGWKLSGVLRLDVTSNNKNEAPTPKSDVTLSRARLIIERWFGDPENPMHFKAIIANTGNGDPIYWKNFYVDIPFFFDSTLIAGRFGWDAEAKYYVDGTNVGSFKNTGGYFGMDSVLTDYDVDAIGFQKNFGIGSVKGYIAHEEKNVAILNADNSVAEQAGRAWEFFGMGEFQFNEHFGLDLGFKAEKGDNFEPDMNVLADKKNTSDNTAVRFNNLWHIFAGIRFNFNDDVA
nr:S-layer homology domain-containing protein [Synergistaceae bacterium]